MMLAATPRLSEILRGLVALPAACDRDLHGIALDSRKVVPGSLFLACKGSKHDGRHYVESAIRQGAGAVVVEAESDAEHLRIQQDVPVIPLPALPALLHVLAARFYGEPAARLQLMGITGTNGKTTCSHLLARLLAGTGRSCGIIGTLGQGRVDAPLAPLADGPGTTPDAVGLQQILAGFVEQGVDTVVMEVSSHALHQARVDTNAFVLGLFTNLSRDHLDYHGNMEAYGETKRRLFLGRGLQWAILNLDDAYAAATRELLPAAARCLTWSLGDKRASVYTRQIACVPDGLQLHIVTPWGDFALQSRLLGRFNASNLLAVITAALAVASRQPEFDPEGVVRAAGQLEPVPGRMQRVGTGELVVVVDYAHTPDALEKALTAMREHATGRLFCVFGCGGDRDQGKRPQMGAVAARLADRVILTDDNPRSEEGSDIIAAIRSGMGDLVEPLVERDRAAAIRLAIDLAQPGDCVLVAGKGHETWQEFADRRVPFSDAACIRSLLQQGAEEGRRD